MKNMFSNRRDFLRRTTRRENVTCDNEHKTNYRVVGNETLRRDVRAPAYTTRQKKLSSFVRGLSSQ